MSFLSVARLAATVSAMHVVARLESRGCILFCGVVRAKWVRGADCRRCKMLTRRLAEDPACPCCQSRSLKRHREIRRQLWPKEAMEVAVTGVSICTCRADLKASPAQREHHIWSMRLMQSTC